MLLRMSVLKAVMLFFVIFLWPLQIFFSDGGIPIYVSLVVIGVMVGAKGLFDLRIIFFIVILMLVCYLSKYIFGFELISPLRTFSGYLLLLLLLLYFRQYIYELLSKGMLRRVFCDVYGYGVVACLILQVFQLVFWTVGVYNTEYINYFFSIPRVSGFFNEPSHLAIAMAPYIFYLALEKNSLTVSRLQYVSLGISLFLGASTTLLAVFVVVFLIKTIRDYKITAQRLLVYLAFVCVFLGGVYFLIMSMESLRDRVLTVYELFFGVPEIASTMNSSALLFYKGYESALMALKNYPLGVGILNMEYLARDTSVALLAEHLASANNQDGTSLLFKLISEFGYLGLIFSFYTLYKLYLFSKSETDNDCLIVAALIFGFVVCFIRGTSYFDGAPILGISLVLMSAKKYIGNVHEKLI